MRESFGVQVWSQGPLYPAIIARIDSHPEDGGDAYATRWQLTLYGRTEDGYGSRFAAETHARRILSDPAALADWLAGE
jgi:hypothetical protein